MMIQAFVAALACLGASRVEAVPVYPNGHFIVARAGSIGDMAVRNGSVVSAYYTGWAAHDKKWFLGDVPWGQITHLNYAFFYLSSEGVVETGDSEVDMYGEPADIVSQVNATLETDKPKDESAPVPKLPAEDQAAFSAYAPLNTTGGEEGRGLSWFKSHADLVGDTKVLLSVGGWTWSKHFPAVCADALKRKTFVESSVALVEKYGLAGIDVDFEFPEEADKENYVTLLKELREGLDKIQSDTPKLITIAVSAIPSKITAGLSKDLGQYLDLINVMAYDFMGYWQDFYQDSSPLTVPTGVVGSGDSAIKALTDIGFDKSQIVLGLPAYGKAFKKSGEKVLKESVKGSWDTEDQYTGILDYSHIQQMVDDKSSGWVHEFNQTTAASTAIKGDFIITYDCVHAVHAKKMYADAEGLAGLFLWELSGDRNNKLIGAMNGVVPSTSHSSASIVGPSAIPGPTGVSSAGAGATILPTAGATTAITTKVSDYISGVSETSGASATIVKPVVTDVAASSATSAASATIAITTGGSPTSTPGSRRCQGAQLEIFNNNAWIPDGIAKCTEVCGAADVGGFKCANGQMLMCTGVDIWSESMGPCVAA